VELEELIFASGNPNEWYPVSRIMIYNVVNPPINHNKPRIWE
jgi:hypothetical protein